MGGFGSGDTGGAGSRGGGPVVEHYRRLDVRELHRGGYLEPGTGGLLWGWWDAHTGEQTASINLAITPEAVTLNYTVRTDGDDPEQVRCLVPLEWTRCNYGGSRPWFLCPGCARRCAVLYGARHFRCRRCFGLAYTSQREGYPDRMLRKRDKIRRSLGADPGMGWIEKPPRMHWRTFERLRGQADDADDAAMFSVVAKLGIRPWASG